MATKKGQYRKTARKAYKPKKKRADIFDTPLMRLFGLDKQ